MSERIISAVAPSNIALMKYMGKKDGFSNIPENPSLSMTLDSLCTSFEVTISQSSISDTQVQWVPELPRTLEKSSGISAQVPSLDERGLQKVIGHFGRMKNQAPAIFQKYGLQYSLGGQFVLRSANTFPAASGIASSASSFAALTLGAAAAFAKDRSQFEKVWQNEIGFRRDLAQISRLGSGSSCRSFEGPWVLWKETETQQIFADRMPEMAHFVILIKTDPKRVSSSEAHTLIRTSPLWQGRPGRVENRMRLSLAALSVGDLPTLARLAWSEAWEMHSLFHTCSEPFSYWEPGTVDGLHALAPWIKESSPPIVTLDAGPNIHVIVKKSDRDIWKARLLELFPNFNILEDQQGNGPKLRYS